MRTSNRTLASLILSVLLPLAAPAQAGYRDELQVTDLEIVQLPKFCWAQMGSPVAKGPGFHMPADCGPGMNHYCPGLVKLMRAKAQPNKAKQLSLLRLAESNVRYTLDWMKKYPACPIRAQVEGTLAEITSLQKAANLRR